MKVIVTRDPKRFLWFSFPIDEEKSGQANEYFFKEQKKRERTRFNIFQRAELEKAFAASPYLAPRHRYAMASRLGVKPVAIQVCFLSNKKTLFKFKKTEVILIEVNEIRKQKRSEN